MRSRAALVTTFLVAYLISYFFRSTNAVLADDLARDAGLGPEQLGAMTSLFYAAFALAQLPLGAALDRWGPRVVTPALMLVAVAGSLVTAAAPGFPALALGRALVGVGMAGVLVGALKAMAAWFPPARFATVSSLFVGLGSLGALGATTPLAAFADALGWRSVFLVAAGITAAVAAALVVVVRAAPPAAPGDDARASRAAPDPSLGPASAEAPAPARHPAPVHYREIFADAAFWRLALLVFALAGALFAFQGLWGGPFLTTGLGLARSDAARALFVLGVAATAGYLASGPAAARFGTGRTLAAGAALAGAALVALAVLPPGAPLALHYVVWTALGAGTSVKVLSYAAARARYPGGAGHAITAANLFAVAGGAVFQAGLGLVVGAVARAAGTPDVPPLLAYRAALWTTAALVVLALVAFARRARHGAGPVGERAAGGDAW